MSTGVGFPSIIVGRKQGTACRGGKPIMPTLVELVKPKTLFAVEKVILLAISSEFEYRCFMCLELTIIFVLLFLNPIAIMSKIFSYTFLLISSIVLFPNKNFSSSVIWNNRFESNLSCKCLVKNQGIR